MKTVFLGLSLALVATFLGCGDSQKASTQTITLGPGSTLTLSTATDGKTDITATVPSGSKGAGTYKSSEASLVDEARAAKNSINDAGVTVEITVDSSGRLLDVRHTATKTK